jgi:SAM-dependent methyltransferase
MPSHDWHNLALYQQAVQHPLAEAFFLARVYEDYNDGQQARTLREDFCGSAAVSMGWIMADPDRRAVAVDNDAPTLAFAREQIDEQLGHAGQAISLVGDDVLHVHEPKADLIASLNFSTLIWHDRPSLLHYFQQTLANLNPGGVFVMDLFGGPGAMHIGTQNREMMLEDDTEAIYHWEQRSFDCLTHRIDCRIHFTLPDGTQRRDAFVYDWRLWSIPELLELFHEAGFEQPQVWCDSLDDDGQSDGHYQPVAHLPARHDWVVYLTAKQS